MKKKYTPETLYITVVVFCTFPKEEKSEVYSYGLYWWKFSQAFPLLLYKSFDSTCRTLPISIKRNKFVSV